MATNRIRLTVDFEIHEGKFNEFEAVAKQMAAVSEQEPGTLAYHFFLSADRKRCRLVEGYADVPAIAAHFDGPAVTEFVPQLIQFCSPVSMEFYGYPGTRVTAIAAVFGAEVFTSWQGFDR